jgi:hypothetical protein
MIFGKKDTIVDEEEESKTKLKPFGTNDTVVPKKVPEVETSSSTFEMEMGGPPAPVEAGPAEETELPPKKTNFKDLDTFENFAVIRDYAVARFGDAGKQRKDESREDYIKRWMTSMRQVEWNTTLNAVPELNWIYNASKEDVLKAARAHKLYESVPDWYQTGGQPGIRPFAESFVSAVADPTTALSFGIGAAARYKAARLGINAALNSKIKGITAAAGAEFVIGSGESAIAQQREIELQRTIDLDTLEKEKEAGRITDEEYEASKEEIESRKVDPVVAAASGAFSAVLAGFEARAAFRTPKVSAKEDLEKILASKKSPPKADPETEKFVEAFDKDMEDTLNNFDFFEGRKILDEQSAPTELTNAEIRKDINRKAIDVAKYIMLEDPTFRPKQGQKVSDAVKNLFMSVEEVDDAALDAAIKRAGLTPAEFAQASRTTVADAASVMQGYSALARTLRRVAEIDPEAQKIVDAMYGKEQDITSAMGSLYRGILRLERESKAFVVSSIATTARNVMGTTLGMTMEAAGRTFEGTLYQMGKTIGAAAKGKYERGDLTKGMQGVVKDAFGSLTYLTNTGITAEVVDKLLVDNPALQSKLFKALQETGNADLSKAARMANTFNVAQDALFRRAIFAASVERQLRGVGMDMYQIMADGKRVPSSILQNAADDALKGTFSYMPKPPKAGQVTAEGLGEKMGYYFVKTFEGMPGGSLLVTFPRFMTNAMAFQYRYSPLGATSGALDMYRSTKIKDPVQAERVLREGREKFAKGSVGIAAMYAAYKYRLENQDTEWYNTKAEDGSTVDTRAIFPVAPYLAIGDFLAKLQLGTIDGRRVDEYIQSIVGLKIPSGAQGYLIEQLASAFNNAEGKEAERLEISIGKVVGDFVGRFFQPGQPVFNYFELFDKEAQIARDPNVIEGTWESYFDTPIPGVQDYPLAREAATKRIEAKIPGLKESLPEAVRYLREETPVRGGEFFNTLTGMRTVPRVNEIEKEFVSLGLDPYTFFGSTGDKTYDRAVIKNSQESIKIYVNELLSSDRYKEMTRAQKKLALSQNVRDALEVGRGITQGEMSAEDIGRLDKMKFNKLPAVKRAAINELYAEDNDGRTLDQDKAYDKVHEYEGLLLQFR